AGAVRGARRIGRARRGVSRLSVRRGADGRGRGGGMVSRPQRRAAAARKRRAAAFRRRRLTWHNAAMSIPAERWLRTTPAGLFCEPGGFHIDPTRAVDRAVITHGHSDHARSGHAAVLATAGTLAIMRQRYGDAAGMQAADYGERIAVGGVAVTLAPAGHVLGSAQVVLEYGGQRVVVSGDYKRRRDPTCTPFEPQPCDVFVTEATFGLPVFRHPPDSGEIGRLLHSVRLYPERCHVVGVYALGKCQRV